MWPCCGLNLFIDILLQFHKICSIVAISIQQKLNLSLHGGQICGEAN